MTIHDSHPFDTPAADRDPLRRFRGRLAAPLTIVTTGTGRDRAGLTVSSLLIADGRPAEVALLVDPDSELAEALPDQNTCVINLLSADHRGLIEPFAGLGPAPGGKFRLGEWSDSDWGPVLTGSAGWIGARMTRDERRLGFAALVTATVEHVEVSDAEALVQFRGRARDLSGDRDGVRAPTR